MLLYTWILKLAQYKEQLRCVKLVQKAFRRKGLLKKLLTEAQTTEPLKSMYYLFLLVARHADRRLPREALRQDAGVRRDRDVRKLHQAAARVSRCRGAPENYMAKYESGAEVRERDDDDSSDGDASDDGGVSAGARKDMPFIKEQSISTSFLNGVWSRRLVFLRHQPCAQLAVRRRYPSRRHCAKLQEM